MFTFLGFTTINIYSQIGLITLVGLIAKNGILIVEFANRLQEQHRSKLAAIREASMTRLRPVLMTTAATVFGHMPLVFVTGAGAEARNSIGIMLVTGMTIGTLFTLFILPAVYMLLAGGSPARGGPRPRAGAARGRDRNAPATTGRCASALTQLARYEGLSKELRSILVLQRSGEASLRFSRTVRSASPSIMLTQLLEIVRTIDDQADKPQVNHTHSLQIH